MAQRFGKYELIKRIASGGMGEVYLTRAVDGADPEKSWVLKRILPHLSDDKTFLDLFLDEARIAARLNHPNIVQIVELGDVEGAWYLLMEYVAGKDLRQVMQTVRNRRKTVPVALACRIIAEAAAGLDYAHRAADAQGKPMQIVHRDVSPHNVLLSFDGAVKLIDFGVAKAVGRIQETEGGLLRGKYPYMSPEQVTSGTLDHRSDQFSLAVVLWELLAGQRLFKGSSDPITLDRVARCDVKPPTRKEEALPAALVETLMRALSKYPNDRFADTGAFHDALKELATAQGWPSGADALSAWLKELYPDGIDVDVQTGESQATRSSRPIPIGEQVTSPGFNLAALRASSDRETAAPAERAPSELGSSELPQTGRTASTQAEPRRATADRPPGSTGTVDVLPAPEGVALFIARAQLARSTWNPADSERATIQSIVQQLKGVAGAIELAAARAVHLLRAPPVSPVLPAVEAADTALRSVVAWSWSMLEGHEQLALAQLSVVADGFGLETAETQLDLAAFPKAPWALDVIQALRDSGLIRAAEHRDASGELRFELLPGVRAFALHRLTDFGPGVESAARARLGRVQ